MDAAIKSLSEAMEKAYQNFLLRDLVGFVLPGAIFLVSLSYLVGRPEQCPQQYIATVLETDWNAVQVLAFLAASYLTAWILQSVHYGIIDSVSQKDLKSRLLWPFKGICFYMNAVGRCNDGGDETVRPQRSCKTDDKGTSATDLCWPRSLVTRGALAPDRALKKIPGLESLPECAIVIPTPRELAHSCR